MEEKEINDKKAFAFYKSFFDAIEQIPDAEQRAKAYKVLCNYALNGELPQDNTDYISNIILTQAKPQIDASAERYNASVLNGKKGGRPTKQNKEIKNLEKPSHNLEKPSETPKDKYKEKDKVKDKLNIREINSLASSLSQYQNLDFNISEKDIDFNNFDKQKLLVAIEQSKYLQNSPMTFIIDHYADVINGKYKTIRLPNKCEHDFQKHNYTKEQLNSLFDNLDDIVL